MRTELANDNRPAAAPELSILDLLPPEEDLADIARRAERLGNVVVIAMGLCLILAPLIYATLIYGL